MNSEEAQDLADVIRIQLTWADARKGRHDATAALDALLSVLDRQREALEQIARMPIAYAGTGSGIGQPIGPGYDVARDIARAALRDGKEQHE